MRFSQVCLLGLLCQFLAQESEQLQELALAPGQDLQVTVGIGQAKFFRFNCLTPADVVVTVNSFAEQADPLLFLSVDPTTMPSFGGHESSTFSHWLEDKAGVHYATAKGLGPQGGILGLMNVRSFASEELKAQLSLRCSYLVGFDFFFWDHLRSSAVCPSMHHQVCSGQGQCNRHGECECNSHHTGPACEHSKLEILRNENFNFEVQSGHYQYLRVHIPPRFPGGYVEVEVQSSAPLIVLIRYDDLPNKGTYELSNFDDWINRRTTTKLKFKVESNQDLNAGHRTGVPAFDGAESLGLSGLRPAMGDGMEQGLTGNMELKDGVSGSLEGEMPGSLSMGAPPTLRRLATVLTNSSRRLQQQDPECPDLGPELRHPACFKQDFLTCEDKCKKCLHCVKMSDTLSCSGECQECVSPRCTRTLASCAGDKSCSGPEAQTCEIGCGSCLRCLESPDGRCGLCSCCTNCLPLAAKCMHDGAAETRYVFVGILHHRRYGAQTSAVTGSAQVKLVEDIEYLLSPPPVTWSAELYDQFQDLRNVELTNAKDYPGTEKFMYEMEIREEAVAHMQVRTFSDRMTLIHLRNVHHLHYMMMRFHEGPKVSHVLVSSKAAPKTLFDFDQVMSEVGDQVKVHAHERQDLWCAIFGGKDGYLRVTVRSAGEASSVGMVQVVLLVLFAGGLCFFFGNKEKLPNWVRLAQTTAREECPESPTDPLQGPGYSGSDVIDRTVEDQYLHRGGLGDEGL